MENVVKRKNIYTDEVVYLEKRLKCLKLSCNKEPIYDNTDVTLNNLNYTRKSNKIIILENDDINDDNVNYDINIKNEKNSSINNNNIIKKEKILQKINNFDDDENDYDDDSNSNTLMFTLPCEGFVQTLKIKKMPKENDIIIPSKIVEKETKLDRNEDENCQEICTDIFHTFREEGTNVNDNNTIINCNIDYDDVPQEDLPDIDSILDGL